MTTTRSADIHQNTSGYSVTIWNSLRQGPALAYRRTRTLATAERIAAQWGAEVEHNCAAH